MADLLREVQQQVVDTVRRSKASGVGCPLLADEVYSISTACKQEANISLYPPALAEAAKSSASGSFNNGCTQQSSNICLPLASVEGKTSSSNSPAAGTSAAVAAFRRQFLGLEASAAAARQAGQKTTANGKSSYILKSRPGGMTTFDFGPRRVPGYLPCPDDLQQQSAVPNLPAKPGTCVPLVCPRLQPGSCCPPPFQEPLVDMDPQAESLIAQRQAQRMLEPGLLINRLVYDSLEPAGPGQLLSSSQCMRTPQPGAGAGGGGAGGGGAGGGGAGGSAAESCVNSRASSCRTTGSGFSSRSNSVIGDDPSAAAGPAVPAAAACQQPAVDAADAATAHFAYAPGLKPWYVPCLGQDTTLVFESRFESGNLRRALQVHEFEYDLILQPDINTRRHTQFYFFAVSNTRAGQAYRFNIINLQKEDSLYNMGMLPLLHSEREMRSKGIGWVHSGREVGYGANGIKRGKHNTYHTLTFVVDFPCDDDVVHLAHCYPFTYTDLHNQLYVLLKEPGPTVVVQRCNLATSLAGNAVDLLTITANSELGKPLSQRQGVVLSARVHPGESNSSWMMKGALEQLLANTDDAVRLREAFVFKVVPMLNPDGVIVGNYRCSLAGLDLNRVWQEPDPRLQPVMAAFKGMMKSFVEEREVVLFCDMHGHSRKYGIFMYGCEHKGKDGVPSPIGWPVPGSVGGLPGVPVKVQERLFPLMLSLNAPDLFSYRGCNFKVQRSKAGTGRVVGFRELGLVNAFTMEASFCGPATGRFARQHYNTGHLEDMGAVLVRTLLDYWAPDDQSSAADLAAQLMGSSNSSISALGGLGDAEDDVCTDSDDESSEDEGTRGPGLVQGHSNAGECSKEQVAGAEAVAGAVSKVATAEAAVVASASRNVAQLSTRLIALLHVTPAASSSPKAMPSTPAASSAAATAVTDAVGATGLAGLLSALIGSSGAGQSPISGSNSAGRSLSSARSDHSQELAMPNMVAAAKAAKDLLNRLVTARAELKAAAAAVAAAPPAPAAPVLPAAATDAEGGLLQAFATPGQPGCSCTIASAHTPALGGVSACGLPAVAAAAAVSAEYVAADGGAAAVGATAMDAAALGPAACVQRFGTGSSPTHRMTAGTSQLTDEQTLAAMPGLIDLLQQLVAECNVLHNAAAASAAGIPGDTAKTKKKGRRRVQARYGNPEVLRAARAKADAGLAAALPELTGTCLSGLGIAMADDDGIGGNSCAASDGTSSFASVASELPSPTSAGSGTIKAGRQANTAGGTASSSSMLDAERYIELLDKQKQHVGGVLAASSIDNPWHGNAAATTSMPNSWNPATCEQQIARTNSSSLWRSGNSGQRQVAGTDKSTISRLPSATAGGTGRGQQPMVGCAAAAAAAAAAVLVPTGAQASLAEGTAAGITGSRRRSKSAHAWLQQNNSRQKAVEFDA